MKIDLTPEQVTALAPIFAALGVALPGTEPADQAPTAPAKDETYRVRTDRQKVASHAKIQAVNVRWDMKLAGGSRKVSDLTKVERTAYDAEIRACWTKPAGKTVTR
jgi:hypothetical protein